jgi:rare lipoprotein A
MVKVTYGDSSVVVRINDRGPAAFTGREIDLAYGAALKLTGFVARGSGKVGMAVLQ